MKYIFTFLLLFFFVFAKAQWSNTTNQFFDSLHMRVCNATNEQGQSIVIKSYPDSGYILVWEDFRNGTENYDIYAQKYDKNGLAQWAVDGVPVATGPDVQRFSSFGVADYRNYGHACTDSSGGFYVAWEDFNTVNTGVGGAHRVCVQHIKASGVAVFPGVGRIVAQPTTQNVSQYVAPQLIADGNKGFFIGYLQIDPNATNYSNFFVYCFKEQGDSLKYFGGGQVDVDKVQSQQNTFPCGLLVVANVIGSIDDRVQGFHIYPDANKGCGIVWTFTRNSGPPIGGWFMAYNHLCRVKQDCTATKIRRAGTGTVPSTSVYYKDDVVKLYDFIINSYSTNYSCSDGSAAAVINTQIQNGGAGYKLISNGIPAEIYTLGFPKGAVLETDGNINAQVVAVTERSYINSQVTPFSTLSFFTDPLEKYDSIPYQLTTDLTNPDWAYNPVTPASMNKINGHYDTLLNASASDHDFSLTSGGNRAFASTFVYNSAYNPGIQGTLLLQEIKVNRVNADSFSIRINNTPGNKGVVVGKEVATGFQGSEIRYEYPQVAMDNRGNALFYVREFGRYNRVSPIGDSAKLLWGPAGKPSGNYHAPDHPFTAMGGDGSAVISWQDNRVTNPYTGLNIYMRRIDSLTNINYLPPFKRVRALNNFESFALPQILIGTTGQFISFDLANSSNWTEVVQVADQYNLGAVYVQAYEHPGAIRTYNGVPYLSRNYLITPQNNPAGAGNVTLRLFFTSQQFDALKAADPGITSPADLIIIKEPGGTNVPNAYTPVAGEETIVPSAWAAVDGGYYLQCTVNSFSNFFIRKGLNVVPVKWLDVNAYWKNDHTALVQWKVTNEWNIKSYIVQHSIDGIAYSDMCEVTATGIQRYSCESPATKSKTNFYRVIEIDIDGNSQYSKTVILKNQFNIVFVNVYPNPIHGTMHMESDEKIASVKILDIAAKLCLQKDVSGYKVDVDCSGLPAGIYTAIIQTEKGNLVYKKLVLQ